MKRTMLTVALAACALALSACATTKTSTIEPDIAMDPIQTDRADTYSYAVRGMACPNCAGHLKEVIERVPGVRSVDVDFKQMRADVRVDSANAPASDEIRHAGMSYMYEHMGLEYDPDCLDPENRERIRRGG